MPQTNINLTYGIDRFKYIVEYLKTDFNWEDDNNPKLGYINNLIINKDTAIDGVIFTNSNEENICAKTINDWYLIDKKSVNIIESSTEDKNNGVDYIPEKYNMSTIRLYFPNFSVDTYLTKHKYALTISTWICGRYIVLGSYIIDRINALACPEPKYVGDDRYYEYIDLPIIDPMDLIYSDKWKKWRQLVCGESADPDTINSVGSILYCSLHAVTKSDAGYIKVDGFEGCQNSIRLTKKKNDFLNLSISPNTIRSLKRNERPGIECNIGFNEYYNGNLNDYLIETYGLSDYMMQYELVIGNDDDLYAICNSPILNPTTSYIFTKDVICENNFENWNGWKPGIYIKCSFEILNNEGDAVLNVLSNKIPLNKQLYRYFVGSDFEDQYKYVVNNVNLDEVDMNLLNINVVNKTENKIVKVDRPFEHKNNFSQTIFYRVAESYSIFIQTEVNENICLNLDAYKQYVDSFILQIEGVKFVEIGRVQSGVIFKIIGGKLPKQITSGKYYILDQDAELITSGQYTYI